MYTVWKLQNRMHQWETHQFWGACLLSSAPSDPGRKRSHSWQFCRAVSVSKLAWFRCQISDTGTYALLYSVDVSASIFVFLFIDCNICIHLLNMIFHMVQRDVHDIQAPINNLFFVNLIGSKSKNIFKR